MLDRLFEFKAFRLLWVFLEYVFVNIPMLMIEIPFRTIILMIRILINGGGIRVIRECLLPKLDDLIDKFVDIKYDYIEFVNGDGS